MSAISFGCNSSSSQLFISIIIIKLFKSLTIRIINFYVHIIIKFLLFSGFSDSTFLLINSAKLLLHTLQKQ